METASSQKCRAYSTAERVALLETYKRGGITQKRWCEENNIALSTLHKWLEQDKKQAGSHIMQEWAPVVTIPQTKEIRFFCRLANSRLPWGKVRIWSFCPVNITGIAW